MEPGKKRRPKRGEDVPQLARGKTRITIRLDNEVLDWFRAQADAAGGGSYQNLINDALADHVRAQTLEQLLRRVIREELHA